MSPEAPCSRRQAGLGAANAAGWMHVRAWALAIGISWGAIAGDLPDIDHPKARVSRSGVAPRPHTLARVHGAVGDHRCPLYVASAGGLLVALAWMIDNVAAVSHTGAHLAPQPAMRFLLAHLAVISPYAAVCTALGYFSHLVLDSLTGPIPWGWPFACRRISLAPAPLRIRTGSSLETWVVRPALTLAFLEVAGIALARQALLLTLTPPIRRRPFAVTSMPGSRQARWAAGSLGPPFLQATQSRRCRRLFPLLWTGRLRRRLPGRGSLRPPFPLAVGVWDHPLFVHGSPAPPFRARFRPLPSRCCLINDPSRPSARNS